MRSYDGPLPHRPRRVLVAGVSGAGKTTLASRIAEITGGPHLEIDAIFHGPDWTPRPEFLDDVHCLSAGTTGRPNGSTLLPGRCWPSLRTSSSGSTFPLSA